MGKTWTVFDCNNRVRNMHCPMGNDMNIKITAHFNRPKHEDEIQFEFALDYAMQELKKALENHCISARNYAKGSGAIVDDEGVLLATYEVGS
jgi:hypothetical protein